jgi:hypothetical protein
MRRIFPFLVSLLLAQSMLGAEPLTEIYGFQLWQYRVAFRQSLGKPLQTQKQGSSTYEVYGLEPLGILVVEYDESWPHNAMSLQISGRIKNFEPVRGIRLGDSREALVQAWGQPGSSRKFQGREEEYLYWEGFNGSLKLSDGKLSSIRIHVNNDVMSNASSIDSWELFKKAILNRDKAGIFKFLRPDAEIFIGEKILNIDRRFEDFARDPNPEFLEALIGEKNSLRAELAQGNEPNEEMRLAERMGAGRVFKFKKGKIKEVVFFPFGGKFKLFELAYR